MALTVSVDEIVQGSRNPALGVRPHWKRIRLREIATVLNGFPFKSAQFSKGDGIPLIRIRDVGNDSTDTNFVGDVDERYIVEPGDLLVGMDGDFNCARWRGPRGLLNQRVCKVTLKCDQYHPRFLDFALPGYLKAINDSTSSVTVKHLSSRTIEDIPLPFPSLKEQEEIVAELEKQFSRLDEAVANLKRVAAALVRYRASTLTESFAVRPGWAVSSYGEVGVVTTGFTPPTSDEANFGGAIPFFKPTDLGAGENVVAAREYLSDRGLSKGRLLPANSVLVTCIGATIGKTGLARVACATNQQINAVSPDPAAIDPSFLYWWTVSPGGQEQIVSNASATTLPILNKSKFSALAVPLPPIAEQRRILAELDRCLSIVREVDAEVDASLKRAQVLRQAVLSSAFG